MSEDYAAVDTKFVVYHAQGNRLVFWRRHASAAQVEIVGRELVAEGVRCGSSSELVVHSLVRAGASQGTPHPISDLK